MTIEIVHPQEKAAKLDRVPGSFVAQGTATQPRKLVGFIWNEDRPRHLYYGTFHLLHPSNLAYWALVFTHIPPGRYILRMLHRDNPADAATVRFEVEPPNYGPPVVAYPSQNGTVGQTFVAYGTSIEDRVTGQMEPSAGAPIAGVTSWEPGDHYDFWTINFTSVPTGSGYTFRVTDSAATPQATTQPGITVS